ncbi:MAG: hypothetical protein NTZ97_02815 [Candidatus Moranbacteria bacterium]|nr:hypothetical protein [Candidatus Moranbacteria bacterium]
MKNQKRKKLFLIRGMAVLLISLSLVFSPNLARPAYAWDAAPAEIMKQALEVIFNQLQGIILGVLKQTAASTLNSQISVMISGSGGAMFITDWLAWTKTDPENKANKYTNNLIDRSLSGRGSFSYAPAGSSSEGFSSKSKSSISGSSSSYSQGLQQMAKASTTEKKAPQMNYKGNPGDMFKDPKNGMSNLLSYVSGINNPWAFNNYIQDEHQKEINLQTLINTNKGIAGQGFIGKEQNGKTVTPGSTVKDIYSNTQDLGNKILAGATHMPEVITAVVSQIMTKTLNQGIGNASQNVSKETTRVNSQKTQAQKTQTPPQRYNSQSSVNLRQ